MTVVLRVLLVAAVLVAAIATAWSYPTLYGETGLVLMPTADIIPDTFVTVSGNYAEVKTEAGERAIIFPVRILYGASDNTELFVLGAESSTATEEGGFDALGAGFKVALIHENLVTDMPGFSVGTRVYQTQGALDKRIIDAYLVGSKTIFKTSDILDEEGYTFRIHLAGFFTRYTGDLGDENFYSAAAGISYNNFNGTQVVLDFLPELTSNGITFRESVLSFALRRPLSKEFTIEAGTTQPFGEGSGGKLYAGLVYTWGIRETPRTRRPRIDSSTMGY
ncbi:MAG: hypothetical protein ACYDCO_02085 [Armatimonadota bacterium]